MSPARRKTVIGNWKMHGLAAQLCEVERLAAALRRARPAARVAICPPATLIHRAAELAADSPLEIGAQDLHPEPFGARTGDLGAEMLHDAGARLAILGHSERRCDHREDDALIARKVEAALRAGLIPVVCVGETAAERAEGRALRVVSAQVRASLPHALRGREFLVAYEPVWAIGSGATPGPEDIAEVHAAIVRAMAPLGHAPVLYGGSVRPENARALMAIPGVDGVLVGGASLKADDFLRIVRAAERTGEGAMVSGPPE